MRFDCYAVAALVALCGGWVCVEAFVGIGRHELRSLSLSDSSYDALEQKLLKNSKVQAPKPVKAKSAVKPAPVPLKAATLPPKAVTESPRAVNAAAPKATVEASLPSFEIPSLKGAATSITPGETAAGITLGALPWLVAPLIAASALRGVLDKTKSSRVNPPESVAVVVPDLATGAQQGIKEAFSSADTESELTRKGLLAVAATLTAGFLLLGFELNSFFEKPSVEPVAVKIAPKAVEKAPVVSTPKAIEKVVPPPLVEAPKALEKLQVTAPAVVEAPKVIESKVEIPKVVEQVVEVAPAPTVENPKLVEKLPSPAKLQMEAIKPVQTFSGDAKSKRLQADTVSPELLNALKNRKTLTN